jgi:hypothetical protein
MVQAGKMPPGPAPGSVARRVTVATPVTLRYDVNLDAFYVSRAGIWSRLDPSGLLLGNFLAGGTTFRVERSTGILTVTERSFGSNVILARGIAEAEVHVSELDKHR